MRSGLFWDFTQRRLVVTSTAGQPVGPIFKSQAVFVSLALENGTGKFRNVVTTDLRSIKCQNGARYHPLLLHAVSERVKLSTDIGICFNAVIKTKLSFSMSPGDIMGCLPTV